MKNFKKILVAAAHPDDEALGCGGTLARLASEGVEIRAVFFTNGVSARKGEHEQIAIDERKASASNAAELLGIRKLYWLDFPDNRMDSIPILSVTQALENIISLYQPDAIFTHFGGDLNVDHRVVHQAVMTACRPQPPCYVKAIYAFEVRSSTEWQLSGYSTFSPTLYVDISETLDTKSAALKAYSVEMREYPHSRSLDAVVATAKVHGATVGCKAAERFVVERLII